jgi:hypothetical protein
MAENGDLYMRRSLKDTKVSPWSPAAAMSPDIIPYGQTTPADPRVFFRDNYEQDVGRPLTLGEENLIFVRAKNMGTEAAGGSVFLYYVESTMMLFPDEWSTGILKTKSGADHVSIADTQPGEIGVGAEPFAWNPPRPTGRRHYCFVAMVVTGTAPPPIPNTRNLAEFLEFSEQEQLTTRNVFFVDASAPSAAVDTTFRQGDTEESTQFTLTCKNCPLGVSWVELLSTTSKPAVKIAKTKITQNDQVIGVKATIPADWTTAFEIVYTATAPPPSGWQIDFAASIEVPTTNKRLAKYAVGPTKRVTVGTATLKSATIL